MMSKSSSSSTVSSPSSVSSSSSADYASPHAHTPTDSIRLPPSMPVSSPALHSHFSRGWKQFMQYRFSKASSAMRRLSSSCAFFSTPHAHTPRTPLRLTSLIAFFSPHLHSLTLR